MSTSATTLMVNVSPMLGTAASLATLFTAGAKLYAGAATLALVACGALRNRADDAATSRVPGEYPYSGAVANPWERDGGPAGL